MRCFQPERALIARFEAVAVLGVFAVDLLTGQVVARMDKRERNKLAKAA